MPKAGREPVRTCVACRQEADKRSMHRVVRGAGGAAAVDLSGHASGRGAYLHHDPACLEIARKRRIFERVLGATVAPEVWSQLTA
jgi:hypothetical protein